MTKIFYEFTSSRSRFRRYAIVISFLSIHFLALLSICYLRWQRFGPYGTVQFYYGYALNVSEGEMPYRDFSFEYPPLALLPIVLPNLIKMSGFTNIDQYIWLFMLENVLVSVLLGLSLVRIAFYFQPWHRCLRVLSVYSLLSMLSFPLLLGRYDLFPTLLMSLAVAAAIGGQPMRSGIWLGLGVAAKIYPIVLLPILSIYYLMMKGYRLLLKVFVGVIIAICLSLVPFLHIGMEQFLSFLDYHRLRGLQIESIPAGIILLGHVLGATHVTVTYNFGAFHLISSISDNILNWLPILSALAFTAVVVNCLFLFRHELKQTGSVTNETLLICLMSMLLVFIVSGKVFSPQYIGWLLPFAPFLRRQQIVLIAIIFVMTIAIYPFNYDNLLALKTSPILLLNLRNFLMIGLLFWLVIERLSATNTAVAATRL